MGEWDFPSFVCKKELLPGVVAKVETTGEEYIASFTIELSIDRACVIPLKTQEDAQGCALQMVEDWAVKLLAEVRAAKEGQGLAALDACAGVGIMQQSQCCQDSQPETGPKTDDLDHAYLIKVIPYSPELSRLAEKEEGDE